MMRRLLLLSARVDTFEACNTRQYLRKRATILQYHAKAKQHKRDEAGSAEGTVVQYQRRLSTG